MALRAQIIIPAATGIPADAATNTFHFVKEDPSPEDYGPAIVDLLEELYTEPGASTTSLLTQYTGQTVGTTWRVVVWDLDDAKPRVPRWEDSFTVSIGSAQALPRDVAVCSSWQAARVSGTPQARRRNRVFLGPLNTGSLSTGGRVSETFRNAVAAAFQRLWISAEAGGVVHWVGFSPTDNGVWEVSDGWCDNEYDTQRRRGEDPSQRTSWSAVLP